MSSTGKEFGYTPQQPIAVGGGLVFGSFNSQQYLRRLRGPDGELLEFERRGSLQPDNASLDRPIDAYAVVIAGAVSPVTLFLDIYCPGPSGIPDGFSVVESNDSWLMPQSIVQSFGREEADTRVASQPRRWRVVGIDGEILGFAHWDGGRTVSLDLNPQVRALMREEVDRFLSLTPTDQIEDVLEDFFERYLPLSSDGMVRGEPVDLQSTSERSGSVSGEEQAWPATANNRWLIVVIVLALAVLVFLLGRFV